MVAEVGRRQGLENYRWDCVHSEAMVNLGGFVMPAYKSREEWAMFHIPDNLCLKLSLANFI